MKSKFIFSKLFIYVALASMIIVTGCSGSKDTSDEETEYAEHNEHTEKDPEVNVKSEETGSYILNIAEAEQKNEMYKIEVDSTYLYWLDNYLLILNGSTKCNIFALNVLKKAGYKTPEVNALSRDLFDTLNFNDILPIVGVNDVSDAMPGDLVIWNGHVILFESEIELNGQSYAMAYWAGTKNPDNGDNILNNVCYGKYKLNGNYVVRRPLKKLYPD